MEKQQIVQNWNTLVSRFGSPLYVYDLDSVDRQVKTLQQALPTDAKIFYSLKANPLPAIVNAVRQAGCCLEVCSENELLVAQNSGISLDHILYSGPGKTDGEIRRAMETGVTAFSAESWTDVLRIDNAARSTQKSVRLLLRVNPITPLKSGLAMSGTATQFGFEETVLTEGKEQLKNLSSSVELVGYHIYYGTQLDNEDTIVEAVTAAIDCVERLTVELGFTPKVIDLGGGFPWPFANLNSSVSLDTLKPRLEEILAKRHHSLSAEVWFESGRYLAASSGTLIATVLDIKPGKDESRFVVLDAGINHLGGMSGLGRIPRGYVFMHNLSAENETTSTEVSSEQRTFVVGPLCSPLDCLARNSNLPSSLRIGDIVAIPNVGAYGLTASLVAFLTRPAPVEVALRNGNPVECYALRTGHERLISLESDVKITRIRNLELTV
ncbi:MAG: hypothetical protein WAN66_11970 [Limnoraphis robusta]|uniref:hypothetical protein n=1 Tax=Limnoraphis robusta TaxID=1118279 RepID=UPI00066EB722|nr:hypothetical protein [Limnoraphis robusta]